jgi:F420-dependent methylenetetrahydromethanopterin dehydrogenase
VLSKIIIIENDNKVQCDSEEEVIKLLIDKRYYELSEKEKLEKREMKAIANCINNSFEIVENVNSKDLENKFVIKDETTYVLSLLIINKIIPNQIASNIFK